MTMPRPWPGLPTVLLAIVVVAASSFGPSVQALRFDLPGHTSKCLAEELQANILALATYKVINEDGQDHKVSVKVTSPYGTTLHNVEGVPSGQFSFKATESGNYLACFSLPASERSPVLNIELDWKFGVAAKDWESVARKDKIEGVELELMKLQGAVNAIYDNLVYLREREHEMRIVSEHTNTRVAWFSICSLLICLLVAGWQVWYLKSYFERKKLV